MESQNIAKPFRDVRLEVAYEERGRLAGQGLQTDLEIAKTEVATAQNIEIQMKRTRQPKHNAKCKIIMIL
jgi:hypothetical protein